MLGCGGLLLPNAVAKCGQMHLGDGTVWRLHVCHVWGVCSSQQFEQLRFEQLTAASCQAELNPHHPQHTAHHATLSTHPDTPRSCERRVCVRVPTSNSQPESDWLSSTTPLPPRRQQQQHSRTHVGASPLRSETPRPRDSPPMAAMDRAAAGGGQLSHKAAAINDRLQVRACVSWPATRLFAARRSGAHSPTPQPQRPPWTRCWTG
jgi:hypothetical protein